jgi:hypothetical protein
MKLKVSSIIPAERIGSGAPGPEPRLRQRLEERDRPTDDVVGTPIAISASVAADGQRSA